MSSHNKEKYVFFYFWILYLYDAHLTYCDNHFMMYINQIMMLYTLNLYSIAAQFCLNKSSIKQKETK